VWSCHCSCFSRRPRRDRSAAGFTVEYPNDEWRWSSRASASGGTALVTLELSAERNIGRLPSGDFSVSLVGSRLRVNVSPDLSVASYVQYDTESDSIGLNTRLRWTFRPVADLFVVYNHNVQSVLDRWQQESNQLSVKLQYAWRW